jgi:hypothetical protein
MFYHEIMPNTGKILHGSPKITIYLSRSPFGTGTINRKGNDQFSTKYRGVVNAGIPCRTRQSWQAILMSIDMHS